MNVTYTLWVKLNQVHKGGALVGGEHNYQLTMSRERSRELYAELKKEFG